MFKKFKKIPILLKGDLTKQIGVCELTDEALSKIKEDSVFSIAYCTMPRKDGINFGLLYLSLTTDKEYKKFLNDKRYEL